MATQQLTFEVLANSSVKREDKLRLTRQASKIYRSLQQGPMRTSELAAIACQYCARINELRHAIIKVGLMIDETKGEGGENQYRIVPIEESTFWRKIINKGEEWKWL